MREIIAQNADQFQLEADKDRRRIRRHVEATRPPSTRRCSGQRAYNGELKVLNDQLSALKSKGVTLFGEEKTQNLTQQSDLQAKIAELQGRSQVQNMQDQATIRATSAMGRYLQGLDEFAQKMTDLGQILNDLTQNTIARFNETLLKVLSTPANRLRGQHPWRQMGAGGLADAGRSALQFGEGEEVLQGAVRENPEGKAGSKDNPMWVRRLQMEASAAQVVLGGWLQPAFLAR